MRKELLYQKSPELTENLRGAEVKISSHALERFIERWKPLDRFDEIPSSLEEWQGKLRLVIGDAKEIRLDPVKRVIRRINNKYSDARYFYNKPYGLRFVCVEEDGSLVVKTVERPRRRDYRALD
ncbi:MAG: hypothetical protein A3B99_04760 [Candidatus Yanofskybacteria bacterium RIFCSPHIGHO2_02_FULL_44_12b]|uniref:Uncharacterized protein n=2 Tax=Candidatus Yanofskyibacteriota TaxID=1752733 RepID=A0A1F8GM40_9BACT|nr:MAG: hypothetical protein UW79_C0003G0020 [Candidatus Yanofskybacteria bacterium GW2011_GWA2_44_9]OGN04378.1 MAG: hypothetical protein A2659_03560 [Candidatus Yanofskybacteria bacterium RIFCSPHIGHO2_01_FULL_44_24]OGN14487.1 MAG: hypothetical protein A3B99_04760 [Candidatus Yanofskybacteria bacterium RIFCSPHIGHO2_02_FULL_44_12b]OGN25768.1 MAG: hypothetical protein A2925_01100 [Candidatus Yanofskybacteria bacterium RIFCSPLOWO2_01_FULL_44_22]